MRFSRLAEWLAWQETLHPHSIDLGLDRVRHVLVRLGWRQPAYPVITVAGTNGKGSCVALLDSILTGTGYRVGTFTSPHLQRYNERIQVAGHEVSDGSLVAAFERIDAARGDESLTFFEFNTLAALLIFETAGLDVVVLEVGMGGRLDAVNVVDADAALIMSIALDHCEWLGNDVESIGREKAGVFRAGQWAIFGGYDMPASIAEAATTAGARLHRLGVDYSFESSGNTWDWRGHGGEMLSGLPAPALPGVTQIQNAAAVVSLLAGLTARLPVDRSALERGLRSVTLAGRFEALSTPSERGGDVEWIFDVAHNPAAALTLAANLAGRACSGHTIAVCGMLGDKDMAGVVAALASAVDIWILVRLTGPRAESAERLQARFRQAGIEPAHVAHAVDAGCEYARRIAVPGDRIVVFGSFLTVGPAREWVSTLY